MDTKLTIKLNQAVIEKAKVYARNKKRRCPKSKKCGHYEKF